MGEWGYDGMSWTLEWESDRVLLQNGSEGLLVLGLLGMVGGEFPQLRGERVGGHATPEERGRNIHILPGTERVRQ